MHKMTVVIINCFDTYEQRSILLKNYFESHQYNVITITSNYRHIHKVFRENKSDDSLYIPVRPYKRNISISRFRSHYWFSKDSFDVVEKIKPDLLWVLVPPNSLVHRSVQYKNINTEVKLIIDIIDMWPETLPIPSLFKTSFPLLYWKRLRNRGLGYADKVVTECNLYQSELKSVCDEKQLHTLYLAKKAYARGSTLNIDNNKVSLCYLGSINNIIDIKSICKLIKELCELPSEVELHIIGDGEKRNKFFRSVEKAGARVFYYGKIFDEKEKQEIFNICHFGLNIMKRSVFVGLTMKTLDYFAGGLPIINNLRGDTWEFVESNNLGINYSNHIVLCQLKKFDVIEARERVRKFFQKEFSIESFDSSVDNVMNNIE